MALKIDPDQLARLYKKWEALRCLLRELLCEADSGIHMAQLTGLPDMEGLLSGMDDSFRDLQKMYDRVECVCEYLRRAMDLYCEAEAPADYQIHNRCEPAEYRSVQPDDALDSWDKDLEAWLERSVSDEPEYAPSCGGGGSIDAPPPEDDGWSDDFDWDAGGSESVSAQPDMDLQLKERPPKKRFGLGRFLKRSPWKKHQNVRQLMTPVDIEPAHIPAPNVSQVRFSAIAPKNFANGTYSMVDVFMYEDSWRHIVEAHRRDMDEPAQEKQSGYRAIAAGADVRIVLTSPDVEIEDNDQAARWTGKYLQFSYAVRTPEDFGRDEILLKATVYIDAMPRVFLTWKIRRRALRSRICEAVRKDIRSAFVSYCSQDRSKVATLLQGMKLTSDIDFFFDVNSMHSGEKWKCTLEREIDRRDAVFLFWSEAASRSEWVNYEWRYALRRKGLECIQPVPLELPVYPPPAELKDLHFSDELLYIINANL